MKSQAFLPTLKKPFGWDLVTVLDPRVAGRTLQLWLMVREFNIAKPESAPAYIGNSVKRVLVSPMVPSDKKNDHSARETISFAVVDTRYPRQMVELCFTARQAELFHKSFAPSEKAAPVLTANSVHIRFKCYVPGCKATSSDVDFVGAHFEQGLHPGVDFEKEKVQIFRVGGLNDRKYSTNDRGLLLTTPQLLYFMRPRIFYISHPDKTNKTRIVFHPRSQASRPSQTRSPPSVQSGGENPMIR